jgi:periplasmic copper chaperone A
MKQATLRRSRPVDFGMAALATLLYTAAPAAERLMAENAWVPWAPPAIKVHAAYLTIVNRSGDDQVIVGADSPDYERVELHSSSIKDGLSEMRSLDRISVPANMRVVLEPGGMHFMLINPRRTYAVDDRIRLVLRLLGGGQIEAAAVVRRRERAPDPAQHQHGGHR